ncbi:MAG: glycosyltransferase [Smithellaceae bacterium]
MEKLDAFFDLKLKAFLSKSYACVGLPKTSRPVISIVIALYNRAAYTLACLESLMAHADVPCEIVLIDNGSTDETPELLGRVVNATVIRNDENLGFLRACNQGAKAAQGKWLLLLNNDTQILPGLLSSMIGTAESVSDCGAVGGRLILPDGTLQEAGGIIWRDASCSGYGRGDDPFKPEYAFVREVHYCSGACLLLKKELFERVGMFDECFLPAYYEETDLCMRIREMGLKIIYQPEVSVIHYEFGSAASMEDVLDLQKMNQKKFFHKWQNHLDSLCAYSEIGLLACREYTRHKKKRILVIDDRIPEPSLGSGYPRTYNIVDLLADLGYAVTFFPLQFPERLEPVTRRLQQKGIEVIYGPKDVKLDFEAFFSQRTNYYDAVWISRPHNMMELADSVRSIAPAARIIYDAEALFAVRDILKSDLDGLTLGSDEKQAMIEEEIGLIRQADIVVTVSDKERLIIEQNRPGNISVLGHCQDITPTPMAFDERKDILFVGAFLGSPSPNEDAILYFVRDIYPMVYQATGAKLYIVGTNVLESVSRLQDDSVIVTGRVDNLTDYFNRCRMFVVPHRYAAGIPLKLLECFSHGLPAVVTPLIAGQLGIDEQIALIGFSADDFSGKLIQGYTDERRWRLLRENTLRYAEKHCSKTGFKIQLEAIIQNVLDHNDDLQNPSVLDSHRTVSPFIATDA